MTSKQTIALVVVGAGVIYLFSRRGTNGGLSLFGTPPTRTAGVIPYGSAGLPSTVTGSGNGITSVVSSIVSTITRAIAPKVTAPGNTNANPARPAGPASPGDPASGYKAPATAPAGLVAPGGITGYLPRSPEWVYDLDSWTLLDTNPYVTAGLFSAPGAVENQHVSSDIPFGFQV